MKNIIGLFVMVSVLMVGCGDNPVAPTATTTSVGTSAPSAPVVVVTSPVSVTPPVDEPFCPVNAPGLALNVTQNNVELAIGPKVTQSGFFEKRYRFEIERYDATNQWLPYKFGPQDISREIQVDRLGGAQNQSAFYDLPIPEGGKYRVRVFTKLSHLCVQLESEPSEWVTFQLFSPGDRIEELCPIIPGLSEEDNKLRCEVARKADNIVWSD